MLGNNCNKIRPTTNGNKKYCRYPHFSGPSGLSTGWEARNLIQSHCGFKNISLPSFSLVGNTRKSNHKQHFHTDTLPALCCRTAEGWAKEAVEAHGHTDVQSLPDEPQALWRSFLVEKTFLIPPPGMTPEGFRSWGGGVELKATSRPLWFSHPLWYVTWGVIAFPSFSCSTLGSPLISDTPQLCPALLGHFDLEAEWCCWLHGRATLPWSLPLLHAFILFSKIRRAKNFSLIR